MTDGQSVYIVMDYSSAYHGIVKQVFADRLAAEAWVSKRHEPSDYEIEEWRINENAPPPGV